MAIPPETWRKIERFLNNRTLIPVLGRGAIVYGEQDLPFYPWLSQRLAERLGVSPPVDGLHQVVCSHLRAGGQLVDACCEVDDILAREAPEPGTLLFSLAKLPQCRSFFTLGFDPLMERALNKERGGIGSATKVWQFSYDSVLEDFPISSQTVLGYLFGKAAPNPGFHLWDADAIELVIALQRQLAKPNVLGTTLADNNLLILGANLSDWLVRFLLRVVRQKPLYDGSGKNFLLADGTLPGRDDAILFYDSLKRGIEILPADPIEFAREFCIRALSQEVPAPSQEGAPVHSLIETQEPNQSIFISYTRKDSAAAFRVVEILKNQGCLVWMDLLDEVGGTPFPGDIRDNVSRRCGLFVSLISSTTESRRQGWFHEERKLAAERTRFMHENEPFYFPVVIDETPFVPKNEPSVFAHHHVTHAPAGELPEPLVQRLFELQCRLRGHSPVHAKARGAESTRPAKT